MILRPLFAFSIAVVSTIVFMPPDSRASDVPEAHYLVYSNDGDWSVAAPGDYVFIEQQNQDEGTGDSTYSYTVQVTAAAAEFDLGNVWFYSPSSDVWYSGYSNYSSSGYYFMEVSDPTYGAINPNSPVFGGGSGGDGAYTEEDLDRARQEGYEAGFEAGQNQGVQTVLSNPGAYKLVRLQNVPGVLVSAKRGTTLTLSLTGNWNRYVASGVPRGWKFDRRKGVLTGRVTGKHDFTIRASRGSNSAAPVRIQTQLGR